MKLFNFTTRLFLATTLVALPFVSFAADEKMADSSALMQPDKSVLDHYLMIQAALAKDSIKGVDENAKAIAKAVRGDEMKMLSPDVATQAETLAKAADLKAAREAFKPLSDSLIKYLADRKAGVGIYHEAFCPMANASWLQTNNVIINPYLGTSMSSCGEFKN
jgi:Cu(I)/Ag(I) efflux system membrane fusion protein